MPNCQFCVKRVVNYKIPLICSLCQSHSHYTCSKLTKKDIEVLVHSNLLSSWLCHPCQVDIFPLHSKTSSTITTNKSQISQKCHTCTNSLGKSYSVCTFCSEKSHNKCFANNLGCKSCARDIITGYDCHLYELYPEKKTSFFCFLEIIPKKNVIIY